MTLNQLRSLPTKSHQMEQPAAVIMGHLYHGVSPQEVHHHHPVMTLQGQDKTIHSQHTLTVLKVGNQDIPVAGMS